MEEGRREKRVHQPMIHGEHLLKTSPNRITQCKIGIIFIPGVQPLLLLASLEFNSLNLQRNTNKAKAPELVGSTSPPMLLFDPLSTKVNPSEKTDQRFDEVASTFPRSMTPGPVSNSLVNNDVQVLQPTQVYGQPPSKDNKTGEDFLGSSSTLVDLNQLLSKTNGTGSSKDLFYPKTTQPSINSLKNDKHQLTQPSIAPASYAPTSQIMSPWSNVPTPSPAMNTDPFSGAPSSFAPSNPFS